MRTAPRPNPCSIITKCSASPKMKVGLLLLPLIAAVFTAPEARWEAKDIISIYLPPISYQQIIVRLFVISFPPTKSVCTFDQVHLWRMRSWDAWTRCYGQDGRHPNPCERSRLDFTLHLISNALQDYPWGMRISKCQAAKKKLISLDTFFRTIWETTTVQLWTQRLPSTSAKTPFPNTTLACW